MVTQMDDLAAEALIEFGGCTKGRAKQLVGAWKKVFAVEALSVVAGVERVTTSVSDLRVERVRALVDLLEDAPLPNPYEIGVLMRIPLTQSRTVLRNWQARYPRRYEGHMQTLAAKGRKKPGGGTGGFTWKITYKDLGVLEYAVDHLRRHGLQQGLKVDRSDLTIEVPKSTKAADGSDAAELLGV